MHLIQDSLGSADFFENVLGFGRPSIGARIGVVFFDVVCDRLNEVVFALEHAASDSFVRDLAEPAFNEVEPRGTGRREVDMKARMLLEPLVAVTVGSQGDSGIMQSCKGCGIIPAKGRGGAGHNPRPTTDT